MDAGLVRELIRVGRDRLSERGVRSAEKEVSPLAWFTELTCAEVAIHMQASFRSAFDAHESELSAAELHGAQDLVETKYGTQAWIERIP